MITFILNDAPYGSERSFNGLRLAMAMVKSGARIRLFLLADAVVCAQRDQKTPSGYYNIARMLKTLLRHGVPVHA